MNQTVVLFIADDDASTLRASDLPSVPVHSPGRSSGRQGEEKMKVAI